MLIICFALRCLTITSAISALILALPLYCCVHISTSYDRQIDDAQQLEFIKNHRLQ